MILHSVIIDDIGSLTKLGRPIERKEGQQRDVVVWVPRLIVGSVGWLVVPVQIHVLYLLMVPVESTPAANCGTRSQDISTVLVYPIGAGGI